MVPVSLQAVFLVGSNVAFLLPSYKSFKRGMLFEGTVFLMMALISAMYHVSDTFGVNVIFDFSTLQFDDFYLAFNIIPVTTLMIMFSTDKSEPDEVITRNFRIKSISWFVLSLVTVTLVRQEVSTGVMVLVLGGLSACAGVVSIIFWRGSIHIETVDFIMMWIFIAIGTVCFFLDELYSNDYYILHSIWHVMAGIGIFFGVEAENKTWNIIRFVTCGKYCANTNANLLIE